MTAIVFLIISFYVLYFGICLMLCVNVYQTGDEPACDPLRQRIQQCSERCSRCRQEIYDCIYTVKQCTYEYDAVDLIV